MAAVVKAAPAPHVLVVDDDIGASARQRVPCAERFSVFGGGERRGN